MAPANDWIASAAETTASCLVRALMVVAVAVVVVVSE